MNNRTFRTTALAALALLAFCGTATAAPRHHAQPAPRHHAPARPLHHAQPASPHHAQPAPPHHVRQVHYAPQPPPPPPPPPCRTVVVHEEPGLLATGACVLGALVGGLLGAAL